MSLALLAGILSIMPTYDYRCGRTGQMFALWQSFADDNLTECPQTHDGEANVCGALVKKVFSRVGISFKGDGFYKNDHGSKSSSESSQDSSSETSKESTKGSSSETSSSSSSETSSSSSADSSSSKTPSSSTADVS